MNRRNRKAFTLVELLLVITIISILAGVIVPKFFGRSQDARITAARQMIVGTFSVALDMFEQDTGRYPTSEEGLQALITNPNILGWKNQYIASSIVPLDPWHNEFQYNYPSELSESSSMYDIVSAGPDGSFGTKDDITNHNVYQVQE